MARASRKQITTSSTAEYFSKNLQQVGFSSPTKAVLTTLKEAVDNSLDACEDADILPEVYVEIQKVGAGTLRNTDLIRIKVEDNGPGLDIMDVPKVFGEYLASSKFGRGRCSRGQQGIGISAATTWAQLTSARGANIITKTKRMKSAAQMVVNVDIKHNKGTIKDKKPISWNRPHGLSAEFFIDGRIQLKGEGGILTYLTGNTLVNPHLTLKFKLLDQPVQTIKRVLNQVPDVPEATDPHPHTMKLGEFIHHSHHYSKKTVSLFLKKGFSRVSEKVLGEFVKNGLDKKLLNQPVKKTTEADFKKVFSAVQKTDLMAPSTRSVMSIGEEGLAKSIRRLGEIDFFSVVTRKPKICDAKPVVVEVAIARFVGKKSKKEEEGESEQGPCTVLRFANRVPLQFDKSACAIVKALESVNWRTYGLTQPRGSLPLGPYIIAVSVVSPFIKFKNASKETIDASDELVEELRRALMKGGQRLSRHIRKEHKEQALEQKLQYIEEFCPILVECLCRITNAPASRKKKANEGLMKILGREVNLAKKDLKAAEKDLDALKQKRAHIHGVEEEEASETAEQPQAAPEGAKTADAAKKTKKSKSTKKTKKSKTRKKGAKK